MSSRLRESQIGLGLPQPGPPAVGDRAARPLSVSLYDIEEVFKSQEYADTVGIIYKLPSLIVP